ncbi:GRAM and VASt domain-containing protein ASCRUDRAFT_73763 [Ascoidea rubescens DSM 1968]|uniref:VASt domain-containing protein n=1 Tax=Ascoidea rubescens DSM 1968 TaxID=1344418 RepID=A0A1D2VR25_9ASCO|nr:hypothetical protein ASCRUDRAFT_73763 [Ascoidea rubescens DSM 1968]ODV64050.1 hypothetical protein ASCRUDRAFT_73763 [Ascoidea rubescens DSM 1968]
MKDKSDSRPTIFQHLDSLLSSKSSKVSQSQIENEAQEILNNTLTSTTTHSSSVYDDNVNEPANYENLLSRSISLSTNQNPDALSLPASKIQFNALKKSNISTLGNGNLSLAVFDTFNDDANASYSRNVSNSFANINSISGSPMQNDGFNPHHSSLIQDNNNSASLNNNEHLNIHPMSQKNLDYNADKTNSEFSQNNKVPAAVVFNDSNQLSNYPIVGQPIDFENNRNPNIFINNRTDNNNNNNNNNNNMSNNINNYNNGFINTLNTHSTTSAPSKSKLYISSPQLSDYELSNVSNPILKNALSNQNLNSSNLNNAFNNPGFANENAANPIPNNDNSNIIIDNNDAKNTLLNNNSNINNFNGNLDTNGDANLVANPVELNNKLSSIPSPNDDYISQTLDILKTNQNNQNNQNNFISSPISEIRFIDSLSPKRSYQRPMSPSMSRVGSVRESKLSNYSNRRRTLSVNSRDERNFNLNTIDANLNFPNEKDENNNITTNIISSNNPPTNNIINDNFSLENVPYANEKKNNEFHQTFKKLPPNERLLEDYVCALSKEIIIQGKMYISERHISFNSNLFGFVTNLSIPFSEILQIEKKSTALLFPNGMVITTLHARYIFASFLQRDGAFDFITSVWNQVLKKNPNRVSFQNQEYSDMGEISGDEENQGSDNNNLARINSDSNINDEFIDGNGYESEISSDEDMITDDDEENNNQSLNKASNSDSLNSTSFNGLPLVGPLTHQPTTNRYTKQNGDTQITNTEFNAPVGTIYSLLFGDDTTYLKNILVKGKNFEFSPIPAMSKNPETNSKERKYNYIKPLGGAIGPKQTRCNITETVEKFEPDNLIQVLQATQSPDVPNGSVFTVKTRFYLNWAPNNKTNMLVITFIEWTGKSWIKGAIEKGTIDGQNSSIGLLVDEINSILSSSSSSGGGKSGDKKRKNKRGRARTEKIEPVVEALPPPPPSKESPYALLLRSLAEIIEGIPLPIPDFIKVPLFAVIMIIGFLYWVFKSKKATGFDSFNNLNQITIFRNIDGLDYTIIPPASKMSSNNQLYFESLVELWEWIDDRLEFTGDPNDGLLQHKTDTWKKQYIMMNRDKLSNAQKEAILIAGKKEKLNQLSKKYTKQEIQEYIKLTELRLDLIRTQMNLI